MNEFKQKLKQKGLTIAEFSRLTGTPYRTAQNWANGTARIPNMAITFLDTLPDKK